MLINGTPGTVVSVQDRGLQYGDGLFETIAVVAGEPTLWQRHMQRLLSSCRRLQIDTPNIDELLEEVYREIDGKSRLVIKIIVTRGSGGRGYRPQESQTPTRLVYRSDWPEYPAQLARQGIRVRLCDMRLGRNTLLAGMKTLNRLEQVLARAEWSDDDIHEGLMLDAEGDLIEGTMSNLFLVHGQRLTTPDLGNCGVAGVMREVVMEQAERLGLSISSERLTLRELSSADAIFLTNCLIGIWPVRELDGNRYDPGAIPPSLIDAVMDHGFRIG